MDRRKHYLDTALRLFAAHGYHGVSIDQLVAEAGGSKATLYRYFSSKQELFEAIIDDLAGAGIPAEGAIDPAIALVDGLRLLGTAIADTALDERVVVLLRLALGEFTRFPELARTLFDRGPAVSYARLTQFLAAKRELGEIDVPDLAIAAEQFIGGIVGHQQLRVALGVSRPTKREMQARIDAAITALSATYA